MVWADGRYKMLPPPDKFFVDHDYLAIMLYDRNQEYTAVYTEPHYGFSYIKRFAFGGLVQNKEYRLAPEKSKVLLLVEDVPDTLYVKYRPSKGQRIHQQAFTPADVPVKGVAARGRQMTSKTIAKITTERPRGWEDDSETSPKGVLL